MDIGNKQTLNSYHVVFLVQNVLIGVNLLSLPHDLHAVGYHQWVMPILFALLALATLYPMIALARRYPDLNLYEINRKLLGKFISPAVNVFLILYYIISASVVAEAYLRLIQSTVLTDQTIGKPLLFLYLVCGYIIIGGIKSIARFCILAFLFTGWMVYFLQWPAGKGEFSHLLPLLSFSARDALQATHSAYKAYFGYELLMIWYPYVRLKKHAFRHASIGIWIAAAFYVSVVVSATAYFTVWQMEHLLYPVLNIFKAVEVSFIERIETMGLSLWVFLVLSTMAGFLWGAQRGLDVMLGSKRRKLHAWVICFASFLLTYVQIPQLLAEALYEDWIVYAAYVVILWPNLLLLLHAVQRRRRQEAPSEEAESA